MRHFLFLFLMIFAGVSVKAGMTSEGTNVTDCCRKCAENGVMTAQIACARQDAAQKTIERTSPNEKKGTSGSPAIGGS